MKRGDAELPVVDALPRLRRALSDFAGAVLVAPPGAGKTTLVPIDLLHAPWLQEKTVVVLEPRRLAARAAAAWMSTLLGEEAPGGTVGYRVRMDSRVGPRTRIEVVTEGVLTRMLQSDPSLEKVGAVVFDEFHERSLQADLGLALALQARKLLRPDLRILVMSATLEATPVARLLGGVPVIASRGRTHPVATRHLRRPLRGRVEGAVVRSVLRALRDEDGDVLAFLPGAGEIRRVGSELAGADLPPAVEVLPLFGDLQRERQERAIAPSREGRRKVVLATSIAETSLTIEGVRVVIDAGLMRVPRFDPASGMSRLETIRVSRDAADQRRGRAGRTAPGVCHRLWTREEDAGLLPRRRPEILEADLAPLLLELSTWGAKPDELEWLDRPPAAALEKAGELLRELGALDPEGAATREGRRMAAFGMHPRLGRMLIRAGELGLGRVACDLAALLGERDVLRGDGRLPDCDLRLRLEAMRRARDTGGLPSAVRGETVDRARLRSALREAGHWRRLLGIPLDEEVAPREVERAGLVASLAYPDRIGRRRREGSERYLLRSGRGARLDPDQPLVRFEWIVAAMVEGRGADARVFLAAPLELEEVESELGRQIEEREEVVWDDRSARVHARRLRALGAIVLAEAPLGRPDPEALSSALLSGLRRAGLGALPWTDHARQLRERLDFLHRVDPATWPDASPAHLEETMGEWLIPFLPGVGSLEEVTAADLEEALLSRAGPGVRERLDRLAPPRMEVPSGSRIRVDYSNPDAPSLAVRIQEVFGWKETPRIAEGRVPLTLQLLSPSHRPTQITTDLSSFWSATYFDVKKDLQGRYPKHFWPDDPLHAPATRGTRPPR